MGWEQGKTIALAYKYAIAFEIHGAKFRLSKGIFSKCVILMSAVGAIHGNVTYLATGVAILQLAFAFALAFVLVFHLAFAFALSFGLVLAAFSFALAAILPLIFPLSFGVLWPGIFFFSKQVFFFRLHLA